MSFINSIFLFATAAAVLPILYHLVRRMKARTVPFSSLMFLRATPKELIRKRRLRDRLLMAARMALLALLALVFARPYLPAEQLPFVPQRERESVVLLVDRSFSMQYGGAFDRAVAAARARLGAAGRGDEFALIAFDEEVHAVAPLASDPAAPRGALDALAPGYRATDYFPALQRAQDVLQEAQHERRVVVLISDFQDAGWTGTLENWKLQKDVVFEPVPVGTGRMDNAYVEAFQLSKQRAASRQAIRYDARIAVQGDGASREREVALVVDGAQVDQRSLPGRTSTPVSFQHHAPREGFYQGSLTLDADALPVDDQFFFTDRVDALPGVLVVDAPSGTTRRDAFYLRNAFDLGEASRFRYAGADRITARALRENKVVFLANRAASGDGERAALRQFVEEGGTLIVSCGDATDPASLNRTLEALGVGRVDRIVDARAELGYQTIIGDADMRHPIFEPFAGNSAGAILRPRFRRYARLAPREGTVVVAEFDSGDAFLAERSVGRGRVLFYASTFNTSWTDLPLDEMFVPFLYQMVQYGARRSEERLLFTVGEAVPLTGPPSETREVRDPQGRLYRVTLDDEGRGYFRQTDVPGHYAVAGGDETRFFSVNVDPRESDLRRRSPEEVYAAVVAPPDNRPTTPEQAAAAVENDERRQKLWRLLLLTVIALFAVETYLANRGTRLRKAGPLRRPSADRTPPSNPRAPRPVEMN